MFEKGIGIKTIQALKVIKEHPNLTPKIFSELMWPDSDSHMVPGSCGYGVTNGIGLWKSAGSFLGRLRNKKLINSFNEITIKGLNILEGFKHA